jgi:hypothetical protein
MYGILGKAITKRTVVYGVYVWFWPILSMYGMSTEHFAGSSPNAWPHFAWSSPNAWPHFAWSSSNAWPHFAWSSPNAWPLVR